MCAETTHHNIPVTTTVSSGCVYGTRKQEGKVKNRLSMFVESGGPSVTMSTEEVLLESSVKSAAIHSGGWIGFKPSDYGAGVSMHCYNTT